MRVLWGQLKEGCQAPPRLPSMEDCEACAHSWHQVPGQPAAPQEQVQQWLLPTAKVMSNRQQELLQEFKTFVDLTFPGV